MLIKVATIRCLLAGIVWFMATASFAQSSLSPDDPPPLPPEPPPAPIPDQEPTIEPGSALDRYQQCFQKMIDAGVQNNMFMRKCLGLDVTPRSKSPNDKEGVLDKAHVAAVVQENMGPLRQCYERLLTQSKGLGVTPEGTVEPRFDILPDGRIEGLQFAPGALTDIGLLGCFREKIGAWRFAKSGGKHKTNARLGFRLKALGLPNAPRASVSLLKGYPRLSGVGMDYSSEDAAAVFRKNFGKVRRCYDQLLKRTPTASGQAIIEAQISAKGRTRRLIFRDYTVQDPQFKTCLEAEVRKWRFSPSRSGDGVIVRYPPFIFAPREGGAEK